MKNNKLNKAAYDLKFLLNRGYRKKGALNFVSNKYLLNIKERNYLLRKTFSNTKSLSRLVKIIGMDEINGKTVLVDGYNVLITTEIILNKDYDSIVMCDDGVLRDLKAVFGKYQMNTQTEIAIKSLLNLIKQYNPRCVNFFYDRPVSKSGELAKLTNSFLKNYGMDGEALTINNVDFKLIQGSNITGAIVATSDGAIIDRVETILDIPYWICMKNRDY